MSIETEPTAGELIATRRQLPPGKGPRQPSRRAHLPRRPGRPQVGYRSHRERSLASLIPLTAPSSRTPVEGCG
jgi:hypothetical protein